MFVVHRFIAFPPVAFSKIYIYIYKAPPVAFFSMCIKPLSPRYFMRNLNSLGPNINSQISLPSSYLEKQNSFSPVKAS